MNSQRESLTRAIGTVGLAAGIINIMIGGGIIADIINAVIGGVILLLIIRLVKRA